MATEPDLDALQRTADYHVIRKKLKQSAIGSLIFGALAVFIGVMLINESILNLLLIVIGILLLAVGIINLIRPTPEGIIIDGTSLLIVAVWNIIFVALPGMRWGGGPEHIKWGIIGIFQIVWSVRRFMDYPRYRRALQEKPTPEELEGMESLMKSINKSNDKEPGYLQFNARAAVLKGLLSSEAVVFVDKARQEVVVAHRNEVDLAIKGKVLIGTKLKATLKVKAKSFTGTISQESAGKLQAWLSPEDVKEVQAGD
jgi:hypothetical protein